MYRYNITIFMFIFIGSNFLARFLIISITHKLEIIVSSILQIKIVNMSN